jgi:hypothetical protein
MCNSILFLSLARKNVELLEEASRNTKKVFNFISSIVLKNENSNKKQTSVYCLGLIKSAYCAYRRAYCHLYDNISISYALMVHQAILIVYIYKHTYTTNSNRKDL